MEQIAPAGPVYQAGTLAGNPLAMTAGIETLRQLGAPGAWEAMERRGAALAAGLGEAAARAGVPVRLTRVGTMLCVFFTEAEPRDWESVRTSDTARYAAYFRAMLARGVYLAPSQFEAAFLSTAHDDPAIQATIEAAGEAFAARG